MTTTYEVLFELVTDSDTSPTNMREADAVAHPDLDAAVGLLVQGQLRRVSVRAIGSPATLRDGGPAFGVGGDVH